MPANFRNARVGRENRAKVMDCLKAAGLRGIDIRTISEQTGLDPRSVAFYTRTGEGVLSHGLSSNHYVRYFHPEHAAGVDLYRAELANRPKPVSRRYSQRLVDDATDLVHKAGDAGITVTEIADALGFNMGTVNSALTAEVKAGRIQRRLPCRESWRYYGLQVQLPERKRKRISRAKPKELHKKPGVPKGTIRKPKEPQQRPVLAQAYAMPRVSAFASAEAIIPPNVKITVCPSGKDHRFTADPEKVDRFFSRPEYRPDFIGQGRWSAAVVGARA